MAHTVNEVYVPSKVDLETGEVLNSMHELHYFRCLMSNISYHDTLLLLSGL